MIKKLLILMLCSPIFISGCSDSPSWVTRKKVETAEERKCVIDYESRILENIPQVLSGNDQDWDDVVYRVHQNALSSCCRTRLYEVSRWSGETGRFEEVAP